MSAFAAAVDVLFLDPNMAADGTYVTLDGEVLSVRVIRRPTEPDIAGFDTRIAAQGAMFDVRVSDVHRPRAGERLDIGTAFFLVQGEPQLDDEGLIWTLNTRPTQ